jgi:hypothetical protein
MELHYDKELTARIILNEILKDLKLQGRVEEMQKSSNTRKIFRKINHVISKHYSEVKQKFLRNAIFTILKNEFGIINH